MVARKLFIDKFVHNLPKSGELIFDIHDNSSIDLTGFKNKVYSAYHYFSNTSHTKQDRAALFLENSIDYIAILLALIDLNIVIVPLNPQLNKAKASYLISHSRAKFIVTSQGLLNRNEWLSRLGCQIMLPSEIFQTTVESSAAVRLIRKCPVPEGGLKFIIYTSGTIGNPKGVMLSRRSVELKILSLIKLLNFKPGASFFSFLPFFSGHGMIPGMLVPFLSGCRMYIARFDPFLAVKFWGLVKEYKINYFTAVPSILVLLKEQIGDMRRNDLQCLRVVFSASYFDSKGNDRLFFKEFDSPSTNNGIAENLWKPSASSDLSGPS